MLNSIFELKSKIRENEDLTKRELALALLDEAFTNYRISNHEQMDDAFFDHFFLDDSVKDLTRLHRQLFYYDENERKDKEHEIHYADKKFFVEKGNYIDSSCTLYGIERDKGFHEQINPVVLFEDEIKKSDWFKNVNTHRTEIKAIFKLEVPQDFHISPLPFLVQFTKKVFGIACEIKRQDRAKLLPSIDKLLKEHLKDDIYRNMTKNTNGSIELDETPRARNGENGKLHYSKEWIKFKELNDVDLTPIEYNFKRQYHSTFEINRRQPNWVPYLIENFPKPELSLKKIGEEKNIEHFGGIADVDL
mgnify:FL=1